MSKISKKYLGPDQVDGSILKLEKDQAIRIKKQDGSEVQLISLDIDDNPMMLGSRLTKKSEHESLQGEFNTEKGKISTLQSEMNQAQSDISSEVARAEGQELTIRSEFAAADDAKLLEAKNHAISQDALKLSEAKEYAELKVAEVKSEIMGGLPDATLNTISEIASAIASEQTATGAILTQLGELDSSKASKVELLSGVSEAKSYTDSMIATIPEVDLSVIENRVSNVESDVVAIESYSKNIVHVDDVSGVDEIGRGSMLRPFKTINFAYSQVPSLGNPSNNAYNANVGKFVTEKLIISLAPGRYVENVVLGFKRARVQLRGEGATIVGDVKTSVKLSDFPCSSLEALKSSFPAPFTGVSAFMNIEISGNAGGGLESDPTSSVFTITGQASLAFEESAYAGFGLGSNWDANFGQFYAYLDSISVGNWVVTTSYTANNSRALPSGVIEVDSCNIASSSSAYRMFFGAVPYSYLSDFATWNIASKGTANKAPEGGLTLKAHNSTFGNVIGPRLTIGEMDGCRIYDIDRTMRGTVDNGAVSGSTSSSLIGFVVNQFRIYSGSGDLASFYKLGQASGATRYKMDSVSHTTLSFNRNSSGVLSARVLDLGAGVSFDFLDDARSISVADPATNYTRTASTVDASLEGIDNALALKASTSALIAGDAASLLDSKAYTDLKISQIPSVDFSSLETIANVDSKDDATLASSQSYTDAQVIVEQNARIAGDDATLASSQSYTEARVVVEQNARIAGDDATLASSQSYTDAALVPYALISDVASIESALQSTQEELSQASQDSMNAISSETTRAMDAEAALDSKINGLIDGPSFGRFNSVVGASTSEFMLDKSVKAIMSCSNGRIALHEGFDFTVSIDSVSGFSKLTFIGPSAMGGVSEIESTDQIFVVYAF